MSLIGQSATVQSGLSVLTLLPEGVAGKTMPCRNRFEASGLADFEKVAAPGNEAEKLLDSLDNPPRYLGGYV